MEPKRMTDLGLLYDFYGPLLTKRQQKILDLCCNNDLSFGEAAKLTGLSRQAVYEILKQSQNKLFKFEDKLHIIKDRKNLKFKIENVLNKIDTVTNKDIIKSLQEVLKNI